MKIVKKKISDLKPAEYNPRRMTEKQKQDIRNSLTEFGLVDPIIVNTFKGRENVIVGGHQRVKVWQEMGNKEVDCVEVCLDLEREKELNVRLNANKGQFDEMKFQEYFTLDQKFEWGVDDIKPWDHETKIDGQSPASKPGKYLKIGTLKVLISEK